MSNLNLSDSYKIMRDGAVLTGKNYILEHPTVKVLVLGISGGIDSALTAALAREVCDLTNTKLFGCYLDIEGNKPDEAVRAASICAEYCDMFEATDLTDIFLKTMAAMDHSLFHKYTTNPGECTIDDRIRAGNIKARLRMIYLYDKANKYNGMVLSTDNLTERNLGFWTLNGDVGDFGFLQELWKTEVYGLSELIGTESVMACVNAIPTDGLGITDSDIDQLLPDWTVKMSSDWKPSPKDCRDAYRLVDDILIDYVTKQYTYNKNHPVVARHKASKFKREVPISIKRDFLLWVHNSYDPEMDK